MTTLQFQNAIEMIQGMIEYEEENGSQSMGRLLKDYLNKIVGMVNANPDELKGNSLYNIGGAIADLYLTDATNK